jgi:hypothetical protein
MGLRTIGRHDLSALNGSRRSQGSSTRTTVIASIMFAASLCVVSVTDWSMAGKAADRSPFAMKHKAMEIVHRQSDGTWRFAVDDPYARG